MSEAQVNADEGWIKWEGGEMPVERGTPVDILTRNGTEGYGVPAGYHVMEVLEHFGGYPGYDAVAFRWEHNGGDDDIAYYRPSER